MGRNTVTEALVLRSKRFAEYHKQLSLLTPDGGIIDPLAYGASKGKSRMAGVTEPFVHLKAWIYVDPVKKQYKLTDAELVRSNDGIRSHLGRFYSASLLCELVTVTWAGGDEHRKLFPLVASGFHLLSSVDEPVIELVFIQLLGRFLEMIGYPPPWEGCERCGSAMNGRSTRFVTPGGIVVCDRCRTGDDATIPPGGLAYLTRATAMPIEATLKIGIERESTIGLKSGLLRLVQRVVETPLRSLRSGASFL